MTRPFAHRPALVVSILAVLAAPAPASAQRGDREGHEMKPPPEEWTLPAPPLSAEEALASFRFGEPGFTIELVAAEPLVINPVCVAFDGNGRPWVCEMRGYMPDFDGTGEEDPVGRISILEDTDGDGRADEARVFLDGLVLPRAIAHVAGGILWADQQRLHFTERRPDDTAGETIVIDEKWASGGNVEHKPNGLAHGLDNWIYNANSSKRYRRLDGRWIVDEAEARGQWGIAQDDFGRLVTNSNSNLLSMEPLPPGYRNRNPHHEFRSGGAARLDNRVWPARVTAGINRGYQKGMLTDEGRLARATGACGPTIYRGDQFPPEFRGNAFICEPCGLLLKRAIIVEEASGSLRAEPAYPDREFLASTDERCRFVNAHTAPDGSLYLVDMVHGIIQHKAYVTTYLRNHLAKHGLDRHNNDRGRLWRVRWKDAPLGPQPRLEEESSTELVTHLGHSNGWWRDTAQRLIVERGDASCAPALRETLANPAGPLAAIHALWCLEGLGAVEPADIALAAESEDPRVLATAARVAEAFAGTDAEADVVEALARVAERRTPFVDPYLAACLGRFRGEGSEAARRMLVALLVERGDERLVRDMAMSGLDGAELEMTSLAVEHDLAIVEDLVPAVVRWESPEALESLLELVSGNSLDGDRRTRLLAMVGRAVVESRHAESTARLAAWSASQGVDSGARDPVVEGMLAGRGDPDRFKPIPLAARPDDLDPRLETLFAFDAAPPENFITTGAHERLYEAGQAAYDTYCTACHQPHGKGMTPLAPPLVDSEWVLGPERRLVALVMEGMEGPVHVNGRRYDVPDIQPVMPGLRASPDFDDAKIAAVLTYVRNTWGNHAPVVEPGAVAAWRKDEEPRTPFTEEELKAIE